jgi:hypothetical protein
LQSDNNKPIPLLLLGSSRSGTTLFQRILNSYDDVIIWGEHSGFLKQLSDSYFQLHDSSSMDEFSYPQAKGDSVDLCEYKDPKQWQAWNNWFTKNDINKFYNKFLESVFLSQWESGLNVWGFKEIRYGENDRVIDFFLELNPSTKVVIIFRNPLNVIESQLSSFMDIDGRLAKLRKILLIPKIIGMCLKWNNKYRNYLKYYQAHRDNVLVFSFDKLIEDKKNLSAILSKIGLEATDRQLEILKLKEGRGSAYDKQTKSMDTNSRWKTTGVLPTLIIYAFTRKTYAKLLVNTEKAFE